MMQLDLLNKTEGTTTILQDDHDTDGQPTIYLCALNKYNSIVVHLDRDNALLLQSWVNGWVAQHSPFGPPPPKQSGVES
jgi:hypothetical protein